MFTTQARDLLAQPLIARLSTIDGNGYPHTVPLWFDLDGSDLIIISDRSTRKVDHIARNPKGCIQIGGDDGDPCGYLFKGTLTVEPDPGYPLAGAGDAPLRIRRESRAGHRTLAHHARHDRHSAEGPARHQSDLGLRFED